MKTVNQAPKIRAQELEDRLIKFGVEVSEIVDKLPATKFSIHIAGQIIRAATAPAANYGEAQSAESRRDFIHKMKICLKELKETRVWLKFIVTKQYVVDDDLQSTLIETDELAAIFAKSIETAKKNLESQGNSIPTDG